MNDLERTFYVIQRQPGGRLDNASGGPLGSPKLYQRKGQAEHLAKPNGKVLEVKLVLTETPSQT